MGKRHTAKRLKMTPELQGITFDEDVLTPRFKAIEGGRSWHPDDTSAPRRTREAPRTQRYTKSIRARTDGQAALLEAIDTKTLVCALGPAGTGKTYLAIARAVEALQKGAVSKIILSRPAIEAGEQIGFLPGALEDKLAPYLRPLYDALGERLSPAQVKHMLADGTIEIAPVAFMRGRTLSNAFIIVDEAQNCTYAQLKMLLTRLGFNSKLVVTGDPLQSDLKASESGLARVAEKLSVLSNVRVVHLANEDVVRHPLVAEMLGVL